MSYPRIPFHVVALGSFSQSTDLSQATSSVHLRDVDLDSLDSVLADVSPSISIEVSEKLCPDRYLVLRLQSMRDFRPKHVHGTCGYLERVSSLRDFLRNNRSLEQHELLKTIGEKWSDIPVELPAAGSEEMRQVPVSEKEQNSVMDDIFSMVAVPGESESGGHAESGAKGVAVLSQVEALYSSLLNSIVNNPGFRELEATWRGLELLIKQASVKGQWPVRVRIGSVSGESLVHVLPQLAGELADDPPHLLLLDSEMDNSNAHLDRWEAVAEFCNQTLTPAAVWIGPRFWGLGDWGSFRKLQYVKHHLQDSSYVKWSRVRETPGAERLAVCMNAVLGRELLQDSSSLVAENEPLWISPVWGLGTVACKSVGLFGTPSRFTDYMHVKLENLCVWGKEGERQSACEISLGEDRVAELQEVGIIPLLAKADSVFVPKESCFAEGSLRFEMFFARLLSFLFKLQEQNAGSQTDPEQLLPEALASFFRECGMPPLAAVAVEKSEDEEEGVILSIALEFAEKILPVDRVAFTLRW